MRKEQIEAFENVGGVEFIRNKVPPPPCTQHGIEILQNYLWNTNYTI